MFNFKTRKQLKEEMESLEKQLEYAEGIVRDVQKENMKLKDEKAELGFRNSKQSKLIKEGRKENKKLKEKIHIQLLAYESLEQLEQELEVKVGRYEEEIKVAKQCNDTYSENLKQLNDKEETIEKLQGFLKYEQKISDGRLERIQKINSELEKTTKDFFKYRKDAERELFLTEEAVSFWRRKSDRMEESFYIVEKRLARVNEKLRIARGQLKREQELRGIDQGRATQEKIELKLDLKNMRKNTTEAINYLKERLDIAKNYRGELRNEIEGLEKEKQVLKDELKKANHKVNKLEYFNGRIEDRLLDEIEVLEREKYELKKRLENILTNKDNKVIKSYTVIPKQNNEVIGIVRK